MPLFQFALKFTIVEHSVDETFNKITFEFRECSNIEREKINKERLALLEKGYDLSFLDSKVILEMMSHLYSCYYDTNQDTEVFAKEFYYLFGTILHDKSEFPISLEFLVDYEKHLWVCTHPEGWYPF